MTTMNKPRSGCEFTNVPGGMTVSCSRGSSRAECAYCKSRPAAYACDYAYRGTKAGQTCGGKCCVSCASATVGQVDHHLCPPHRREADKADAWLIELTNEQREQREATCTCRTSSRWPHYGDPQCPAHRVDSDALEAIFPDWEREWETNDLPPVSQLAGEFRARRLAQPSTELSSRNVSASHAAAVPAEDLRESKTVDSHRGLLADVMSERISTHDFDGDSCARCGLQAMPDGTIEATCAETLQAQCNMYGCRPCPVCHEHYRFPLKGWIVCDDCGHEALGVHVELDEHVGLKYAFEGWLDAQPHAFAAAAEKIASDLNVVASASRRAAATPIADKVEHVRRATQTREHHCHWPGCRKQVKPAYWGCLAHWKMLPRELQSAIWDAYRPGQEDTITPSREYLDVATRVQTWIRGYLAREATTPGEPRRTSWGEAVERSRRSDRARVQPCVYCGEPDVAGHDVRCLSHPDPSAGIDNWPAEHELDPDIGDR